MNKDNNGIIFLTLILSFGFILSGCSPNTSENGRVELVKSLDYDFSVSVVAWHPDGDLVATGDTFNNSVVIWDAKTGEKIKTIKSIPGGSGDIAISPNGRYIAIGKTIVRGIPDGTHLELYNFKTGKIVRKFIPPKPPKGRANDVYSLAFSKDSKSLIASAYGSQFIGVIYNVATGNVISEIRSPVEKSGTFKSIVFNNNGQYFAAGKINGEIEIWSFSPLALKQRIQAHMGDVKSLAYSPDGKYIVSGTNTGHIVSNMRIKERTKITDPIKMWSTNNYQNVLSLSGHTGDIASLSYSNDGRYILSSSADKTVRLWDANNGRQIDLIKGFKFRVYSSLSPKGTVFVTADRKSLKIWKIND